MIYKCPKGDVNTNLRDHSYDLLNSGIWELGFINDNPGIIDSNNDNFYCNKEKKKENESYRSFKNKVSVLLCDGKKVNKHIIHWVESEGWFCITNEIFWDQFENA